MNCHYLISDAEGHSVLVEYYDGALQTVQTDTDYQIASNFIAYQDLNIGEGATEFERFQAVEDAITKNAGKLNTEQAEELLADIGCYSKKDGTDKLQWTAVYNLTERTGEVFAHRKLDTKYRFVLKDEK